MNNHNDLPKIEVELRALVEGDQNIISQLDSIGAKFNKENKIHDVYFCRKDQNTIEDVEMSDIGSYSLRLRMFTESNKIVTSINTKSIIKKDDHNAWEEHETVVDDFDEMANILLATEFKPFFELKKTRKEYSWEDINILVEEIEEFGTGIEIEIMTTSGNEENAKSRLKKMLADIGIGEEEIVPKSITNIIMKQRAFKSKITFS